MKTMPSFFSKSIWTVVSGLLLVTMVSCYRPSSSSETVPESPRQFEGGTLPLEEYWRLPVVLSAASPRIVATRGLIVFVPLLDDFTLRAVGVQNEHTEWQTTEEGWHVLRALAVDGERIYIERETAVADAEIVAYQASDGQRLWSTSLSVSPRTAYFLRIDDSKLQFYANPRGSSEIYNLDPASGEVLSLSRVHSTAQEGRRLQANGREYWIVKDPNCCDTLRSVDVSSGQICWEWTMPGPLGYTPEIAGQRMFLNFETEIVSLDIDDGHPVWSTSVDTKIVSNFALGEHMGCFLQKNAVLVCLDLTTGEAIGQVQFYPAVDRFMGHWVLIDGEMVLVYFGDSGEIIALGPSR